MHESLTLTQPEVREATGAIHRTKQMAWFLQNGIPAVLGVDGKVKVLREAYRAKMMPSSAATRARAKTEPRLDLLKKAS
ncbi:DUF4224 domain-containing protein [Pseudoxanthomonas indica]|nr:DUF4224 domain-containing protein [Pseudoxanthomonas indica]GGD58110.1 hypothetical protein GCM10007235_33030 [Pseudoxanthomonas indica]